MWRIALALVILLTACSSKDDSSVSKVLTGVEIVSRVSNIILQSDTVIAGDVLSVEGDNVPSLTQYECSGQGCSRISQTGTPLVTPLLALADLSTGARTDLRTGFEYIREHRGVSLARYRVTSPSSGVPWTFNNYGAWLTHSAFETTIGNVRTTHGPNLHAAYSISFGKATGTNPEGDGVWHGVMLGNTRHGGPVEALQGDATVRFAFATHKLAVEFNNVVNLDNDNAPHADMEWNDIDVADGAFELRNIGHIAGRFYGPGHAEVGGVFTHPTAVGAFGAKQQ